MVGHGWDWLLAWAWCGSVSFRLTGVARVPRAGVGWLLVGACLVRAFLGMGEGSLVVARGWWSVWARALEGCFLVVVGWLVGVAFWSVGWRFGWWAFSCVGGAQLVGAGTFG